MSTPVIATPWRLAVIAAASFLIPSAVVVLFYGATERHEYLQEQATDMTPERIDERIRPFATVQIAGAQQGSPRVAVSQESATAARSGEAVYAGTCIACHASGAAGAPKFGDRSAWQPRVQQGLPVLVQHAMQGKGAMPAKGGNPTLSEEEIRGAIQYMMQAAGA